MVSAASLWIVSGLCWRLAFSLSPDRTSRSTSKSGKPSLVYFALSRSKLFSNSATHTNSRISGPDRNSKFSVSILLAISRAICSATLSESLASFINEVLILCGLKSSNIILDVLTRGKYLSESTAYSCWLVEKPP